MRCFRDMHLSISLADSLRDEAPCKGALARLLVRKSLRTWRGQQAEDLKVYSRRQLLESLIPEAGGSKKRPKLKKTEGEGKANSKARHSNINQDLCGADPGK